MAAQPDPVKLGLFVLATFGALLVTALVLGAPRFHKETLTYVTYLDESVNGLEVGSPVKARGVPVGRVGAITFAPDHATVEVRLDLDVDVLDRLMVPRTGMGAQLRLNLPPDVRAQLQSQGLTGQRFIALDRFRPEASPPPVLAFEPGERYIPAVRSVQKNIEVSLSRVLDGLAAVIEAMQGGEVAEKSSLVLARASEVLTVVQRIVDSFERARLPGRTAELLNEIAGAAERADEMLARAGGERGVLAGAERALDSMGAAGRSVSGSTDELGQTLAEFRDAAEAIRILADEVERDPDMLVKGRARRKER